MTPLTEKWETHSRCDGTGMLNNVINGNNSRPDAFDEWPCPDCVNGKVPPEGMIEAAAEGIENIWPVVAWENLPESSKEGRRGQARAALVAAKRWEKE